MSGRLGTNAIAASVALLTLIGGCNQSKSATDSAGGVLLAGVTKEAKASQPTTTMPSVGESGAKPAALKTDDLAYLTELSMMMGHLRIGIRLYHLGAVDQAEKHLKRMADVSYRVIEPAISARGVTGFHDELAKLASDVAKDGAIADVDEDYAKAVNAVNAAEVIGAGKAAQNPKIIIDVVERLVRQAAVDYGKAVVKGKVIDIYGYQNGWGFTQVSGDLLDSLITGDKKTNEVIDKVKGEVARLKPAWPTIVPPDEVSTNATLISESAQQISTAARSL